MIENNFIGFRVVNLEGMVAKELSLVIDMGETKIVKLGRGSENPISMERICECLSYYCFK